jgi:peptidoglycan hydrolase-like protein with peptidoglycan-binding domain
MIIFPGDASTALTPQLITYPGRLIKQGERNAGIVKMVQSRLNELGCGLIDVDGEFGAQTGRAVRNFQIKFTDVDGLPLKVDGVIGAISWASLLGVQTVNTNLHPDTALALLTKVLLVASTQVGIEEEPRGSNRGPQVDKYIQSVGLNPAGRFSWCVAFTGVFRKPQTNSA